MSTQKQQCYLWSVWLTWLGLPLLALTMGLLQAWWSGVIVLLVGILAQVLYVRFFPRLSQVLGYGSVEDVKAETGAGTAMDGSKVTLYRASVCPFCPIVQERLQRLQEEYGFELEEVDVTFEPQMVRAKGFRSVPVIEHEGRYQAGNATTAELVRFLRGAEVEASLRSA